MSAPSRQAVKSSLSKHYSDVRITIINSLEDLHALVSRNPDLVFLGMKYIPMPSQPGLIREEKLWISHFLEANGIAHTGSRHRAHQLEFRKDLGKDVIAEAGLNTPKYNIIYRLQTDIILDGTLSYPLFVKPLNFGGSEGIDASSIVFNYQELRTKVEYLKDHLNTDVLIEEYLPGDEYSVSLLMAVDDSYKIMPIKLDSPANANGTKVLSQSVKNNQLEILSTVNNPQLKAELDTFSLAVFKALGGEHYGRIDVRMDAKGIPHFIEANLVPSLKISDTNYFPQACALYLGVDYDNMILRITNLGLKRKKGYTPAPTLIAKPLLSTTSAT